MSRKLFLGALVAASIAGSAAIAKQYVDYTPQKGLWQVTAVEVDPNHVDEYLTGLRRSQVPGFEVLKARGILDGYKFLVRTGYSKGSPNVLIMTHLTNAKFLEPDRARDEAIEKELLAKFSKEQGDAAVAGYEKYRQFVDDSLWTETVIAK